MASDDERGDRSSPSSSPASSRPSPRCWGRRAVGALALGVVIAALPTSAVAAAPSATTSPRRVLVMSLPTLTWNDLAPAVTPNLSRSLDRAAIADLATRADREPADLGAAYVTIGAGARAAGDQTTDGEGL